MAELLDPEQWGRGGRPGADETADARPPGPRRTGSGGAASAAAATSGSRAPEPDRMPFDEPAATAPRREATQQEPRRGATPPPSGPSRERSRLPLILAIVLVVLALVAGGVWAAASGLLPGGGEGDPAAKTPVASAPATEAPEPSDEPTEEPSAPAEPVGTPLPASCDELYSDTMRTTIEGAELVLNPEWHQSSGEIRLPSEDPQLQEILGSVERLDCAWLQESPGEVGIYTSVSQVTADQAAAANARMIELGYRAIEELGGVRYITELSGDGNTLGESHFLRDGLWFGTLWINYGPAGYTADMVTQVLG